MTDFKPAVITLVLALSATAASPSWGAGQQASQNNRQWGPPPECEQQQASGTSTSSTGDSQRPCRPPERQQGQNGERRGPPPCGKPMGHPPGQSQGQEQTGHRHMGQRPSSQTADRQSASSDQQQAGGQLGERQGPPPGGFGPRCEDQTNTNQGGAS